MILHTPIYVAWLTCITYACVLCLWREQLIKETKYQVGVMMLWEFWEYSALFTYYGHYSWTYNDVEHFRVTGGFSHKGPFERICNVFLNVRLNLLDK